MSRGVDGTASRMDDDEDGAAGDALAGAATGLTGYRTRFLGQGRRGPQQRGRRDRVRRVGAGRVAVVPGTRRPALVGPRSVIGQVSVIRGARGDGAAPGAGRGSTRDRSATGKGAVDDLARAATQRRHAEWTAGLSSRNRAVEGGVDGPPPQ